MWLALLAFVAALGGRGMQGTRRTLSPRQQEMAGIVRAAARELRVPEDVALTYAFLESRLNPMAEGDLKWPQLDGGERYARAVLDNPQHAGNPARTKPELWHSYGLFQLLAPYHVQGCEDPRVLLEPELNARRGLAFLKRLAGRTGNDYRKARLMYTGASNLAPSVKRRILAKYDAEFRRWQDVDGEPRV